MNAARRPKLLIIDDGDRHVELAHALLRDYDYATRCALASPCWECPHRAGCTLTHAHDYIEAGEALSAHADIDAVLLDVAFDLGEARLLRHEDWSLDRVRALQGLLILRRLRSLRPHLPVVLMTSREQLRLEQASEALEADEFVTLAGERAFDARALALLIERVLARRPSEDGHAFHWGRSARLAKLRQHVVALSRTSLPMLLLGETGTGKSALAEQVIHPASGRSGPFVALDLSALPENLVAAELFGTARGAFSGAVDRRGRFEQAAGGTLFLDEIGNLPLEAQRTLLLVLQNGRVSRLGESTARAIDVKLVAATNIDLKAAVREGRFRADLYARLNPAAGVVLPPLRERLEELPALAQTAIARAFTSAVDRALLERYLAAAGLETEAPVHLQLGRDGSGARAGVTFAIAARGAARLTAHPWPGNVRELSLLLSSAALITLGDALSALEQQRGARGEAARVLPIPAKLLSELLDATLLEPGIAPAAGEQDERIALRLQRASSLREVSRTLERELFERLFSETGGDYVQMAARLLSGDPQLNARRVQLRFNQLGLRARAIRRRA